MDFSSISAFMAVTQYKSISKAAASLYLSQSNLSARISKLEKEIGYELFFRQRGKHTVELTPKGEQFMEYAEQISNALVEIENLAIKQDRQFLSIGANAGTHQITLNAFYQDFIQKHSNICLGLHTYHSSDIYNYVNSDRFQLGIVSNAKKMPDVSTTLIYEEPLFIVANHDSPYYNGIMPQQLPGNQEIFMAYNQEYIAWHEQYWPDRQYFARLSDGFDLPTFFNDKTDGPLFPFQQLCFLQTGSTGLFSALERIFPTIDTTLSKKQTSTDQKQQRSTNRNCLNFFVTISTFCQKYETGRSFITCIVILCRYMLCCACLHMNR